MPRKYDAAKVYADRVAAGLCGSCGGPVTTGTKCDSCKAVDLAGRQKRLAKKKAAGICVSCSNQAKPGCTLCQVCIDKRSLVAIERYQKNKKNGVCRLCGSPTENNEAMCETHKQQQREYRQQVKLDALNAYGGPKCQACAETDENILEIDHIAGGGNAHRRTIGKGRLGDGSGYNFYRWLKNQNYPPGYRVLCPTCNKKAHLGLLTVT